uniref:Uncharacterized protein n=1 Tax=viral metagenome TaxID=1070528 RepID=A0A6H1ZZ74_9ZZZZ
MVTVSPPRHNVNPFSPVKWCGLKTKVWHYEHPPDRAVTWYCDRWDCPRCGPLKIERMMKRLEKVHFTHHFEVYDPRGNVRLGRSWATFWRRVKRQAPGIRFVALLTGDPDHAAAHVWCETKTLDREAVATAWEEVTGGELLTFQEFIVPEWTKFKLREQLEMMLNLGPRFRTIRATRGWAGPLVAVGKREDGDKPTSSYIRDVPLQGYATMLQRLGYQVKWEGEDQFWFWPPAEGASLDTPQRAPPGSPQSPSPARG